MSIQMLIGRIKSVIPYPIIKQCNRQGLCPAGCRWVGLSSFAAPRALDGLDALHDRDNQHGEAERDRILRHGDGRKFKRSGKERHLDDQRGQHERDDHRAVEESVVGLQGEDRAF